MDGDERHRDIIVPSIYSLLCLCVTAGGVFLVLYVFFPALSQPWQPIAALILIGSPWLVWVLTFIYSCAKACCVRGGDGGDRQIPKRQMTRNASASVSAAAVPKGGKQDSVASSNGSEIQLASSV
ncbi:hypothetical protein PHJA_001534900 [Phtheirospermum japonicum]|uniref:Uncharacterized protein n=1 Tax=Phtheirospermum japonicum TaxID=374723 RepID=A0A830C4A3_9LAMI|nr:hypothetical protein PHJA_001534900 [Phtheirospermum japonicum]